MENRKLTIALAGNPNSGKSSTFNAITGSRQHVGNYPGVTVEKKQGAAVHDGVELEVVDLPGTYSLTANSLEEVVARNFILDESPDVVVDVIDSSNLERNLYLAVQLMELSVPLVLAFNMSDIARARGYSINIKALSKLLGVPIVRTIAHKGRGMDELLTEAVKAGSDRQAAVRRQSVPTYGQEVEPHVRELAEKVAQSPAGGRHDRWYAVKLLEGDEQTAKRLESICGEAADQLLREAERLRKHISSVCGDSPEIILADRRYGYISGACKEVVRQTVEARHERSDKIDAILTNRYLGLPIFAALMYLLFQLTFAVGNPMVDSLEAGKEMLATWVRGFGGDDNLLISLLADGIIEGVGAVMVFLPLIMLLYLGISILQDTGYMARAAFVLDSLMHKIGLHGKSFIPMLLGFGCTVPAIMSTRILDSRKDRLTTILVLPLMSCGARLPVYVLLIGAFFPAKSFAVLGIFEVTNQALLLFGIYVVGIVLALVCARILRRTFFRGEAGSFVMELPPYRLPAMKGLLVHMWENSSQYLKKAGTIILAVVVVLWALKTWPSLPDAQRSELEARRAAVMDDRDLNADEAADRLQQIALDEHRQELLHSAVGRIGHAVAPALAPCGFDWKISTALLGAFAAKEVFLGQMGVIYAVGDKEGHGSETLRAKLSADYSPLQGICIMLFVLIASPCVATVAVTVKEASWKWALVQWTYLTVLAWAIATMVYQLGSVLGLGSLPAS